MWYAIILVIGAGLLWWDKDLRVPFIRWFVGVLVVLLALFGGLNVTLSDFSRFFDSDYILGILVLAFMFALLGVIVRKWSAKRR